MKQGAEVQAISEEQCLAETMRLRHLEAACAACGRRAGFAATGTHRAFACNACGYKIYPCQGTPFSKPQPQLVHWFHTLHAHRTGTLGSSRDLARALGTSKILAEHLHARAVELELAGPQGTPPVDWYAAASDFVSERRAEARTVQEPTRPAQRGETAWATLRSLVRLPDTERLPYLGAGLILVLVAAALAFGTLLAPSAPEEDQDLVQATAILQLAPDSAVLLVSEDVAAQLYDVSDLDASAASPLIPVIKLVPSGVALKRIPLAEAQPLSRPAVKLATSVGSAILSGDLSAARKGASARPELAAYESLAIALESSGPSNPDEVLIFGPMKIRRHLVEKIVRAARITKTDPVLLMAIADKESSFATEVQAQTSSATGLFQFIERTWLGVIKDFGSSYGLEREARVVAGDLSSAERTRILTMRNDAYLSAVFAAEMLKRDSERIGRRLGRPLTGGETYLIHFLGPDGAERLLARAMTAPDAVAADLLPKPAEANRPIFYSAGAGGERRAVSVSALRDKFETMIGVRLNRYRNVHTIAAPGPAVEPLTAETRPAR
ncbi:hypothetical protein AFCDBAGC_3521 [Methylobacterium cerastii]|uniref:Transglycosylase SLT domain-containing protein n=1 Tax=Methylobacterium cerastii TaxID=932741 RepID=A0ABQ4QKG1_9HYPH|nr:hypothetical protein AFCDBAGC_3521 [Methylobacterium cerastii]